MLKDKVFAYLLKIPSNMVATYKDIAIYADSKGYQAIGQILHTNDEQFKFPCYKVVKSDGSLSSNYKFGGLLSQKKLLLDDNIPFIGDKVDLAFCQFSLVLETSRLYLRKLRAMDLPALVKMMNEDVMWAWERPFSEADVLAWYQTQIARYQTGFGLLACVLKETGEVIGQVGLIPQQIPSGQVVEVSYILDNSYWHKGYAKEAVKALISYGFTKKKLPSIYATIKWNNLASQKVAVASNMVKVGEYDKIYYNKVMKQFIYRIDQNGI